MLSNMGKKKHGVAMFACKMSVLSPLLTVRNMAFQEWLKLFVVKHFAKIQHLIYLKNNFKFVKKL